MLKRNKGMAVGQVVVYILSLLIFLLIIYYGYNSIQKFWQDQEKIELLDFKKNVAGMLESVVSHYGDVKVFVPGDALIVPGKYKELCFIGLEDMNGNPTEPPDDFYPLIGNSWDGRIKQNVFLVIDDMEDSFYVEGIRIDNDYNYECFNIIDGKVVNLKIEGKGEFAEISRII